MMRSLFAMLSLLVCTATASAECAWVLWQKVGVRDQANTAMGSASPCQAAIADRLQRAEELGYQVISHEPPYGVYKDPKDGYVSWRCFPDTVQPRGQKGKP